MGASGGKQRQAVAPISDSPSVPRSLRQIRPHRPPLAVCHLLPGDLLCPAFEGFRAVLDAAAGATADAAAVGGERPGTIFFFHGVGGSCNVFFFQIAYLQQLGFEVVAMDLLGHGRSAVSSVASDYAFEELAQDALSLFDEFASPGKLNALIGHSYGTAFVTGLCVERSQRVSRAVLIAGGGPSALGGAPFCLRALSVRCLAACAPCARACVRRLAFASTSQPPLGWGSGNGGAGFSLLDAPAGPLKWTLLGQHWPQAGAEYHAEVGTPILLMHGTEDRLVSADDEEWMLETLPLARLIRVPDAGHMMTLEAPETVNGHIGRFLLSANPVGHGRVPPLPAPPGTAAVKAPRGGGSQSRRLRRRQHHRQPSADYAVAVESCHVGEGGGVDNPAATF